MLGSIFTGIATPTESASVGVFCAIILAAAQRRLSWEAIRVAGFNTLLTTSMIMLIIVFTYIMASVFGALGIAEDLLTWSMSAAVAPVLVVTGMCVMYLILGAFIEGLPLKVLTLGIVYPVIMGLGYPGYDGIWLGILTEIVINIGMLTPPVGVTLFVVQGIAPNSKLSDIFLGTIPFILIMILVSGMLLIWPGLATWLPSLMIY